MFKCAFVFSMLYIIASCYFPQASSCEWLVEAAICVRRGRFRVSVKDPVLCPMPCPMYVIYV